MTDLKDTLTDEALSEATGGTNPYGFIRYYVQEGDTLWKLAKRFRTTVNLLAQINCIKNPCILHVGQVLLIPVDPN